MNRPRQHSRAAGFTLVEAVLSIAIMAVIMLGMQSAMMLASRASPDRDNPNNTLLRAAAALDQLAADLTYATTITTASATVIEFTVPDRNNDGTPETIRYSWSGVAGAPLQRTYNGGAASNIATGITDFQLVYDKRSQARATTYSESGEVVLSSYDGAGLLNLGNFTADTGDWVGQYFRPTLPAGATHWRVTRAKFKARTRSSSDGSARVQLRTVNGTAPGTVIEEAWLWEWNLDSNYSWQEFSFSNVSGRPAGSGLCLVVQGASSESCEVQYHSLLASGANTDLVRTTNSGSSWSTPSGQDMLYYIYGHYKTPDPAVTDYWLTSVRCGLRSGADPRGAVRTTIRVLNEPQVAGP